ncbi:MAG: PEP-CTERM sorting domain-containing protein [Planctomycetes bacterium]|nr:PEP-CTERM sorting domain-containing protein [Planctomycetota bacterium]
MLKKTVIVMVIAIAMLTAAVQADMTYAPFMFDAYDALGNPIADGTYLMVLDLDNDGWGSFGYLDQALAGPGVDNASSWLWDNDDLIMDRGQIINGEAFPFATIPTATIPGTYSANVDEYYLLWLDLAFDPAALAPGANVHYGAESLGVVGTDPGDYGPFPMGGNANLVTVQAVPEPASTMLFLVGSGLFFALRRNRQGA